MLMSFHTILQSCNFHCLEYELCMIVLPVSRDKTLKKYFPFTSGECIMADLKEGQEMGMQATTSGLCRADPPTGPLTLSRSPRAIPFFFCMQFSMESNHYERKPRSQSLSFS